MRKLFEQSLLLSRYIAKAIGEGYASVWIAGGAGRSKNGHDEIKAAVIKMIALSKDRSESFASFMTKLNIVPVSISYEFDPSDVLKTYEWTKASEGADYKKGKREDFFSILKSLRKQKGRINITFCDPIELEPEADADGFAKKLERGIRQNYRLYDVNYFAYDQLHGTNLYADKYDKKSLLKFFFRCNHMSLRFRENILAYYANPVVDKLEIEKEPQP